jgi:hypothetical protein
MRRWSTLLAAFSLLAIMSTGCWEHTAGVCDCDPWHDHHPFPDSHGVQHSYADVPQGAAAAAGMVAPGTVTPTNGNNGSPVTTPQSMPPVEE